MSSVHARDPWGGRYLLGPVTMCGLTSQEKETTLYFYEVNLVISQEVWGLLGAWCLLIPRE